MEHKIIRCVLNSAGKKFLRVQESNLGRSTRRTPGDDSTKWLRRRSAKGFPIEAQIQIWIIESSKPANLAGQSPRNFPTSFMNEVPKVGRAPKTHTTTSFASLLKVPKGWIMKLFSTFFIFNYFSKKMASHFLLYVAHLNGLKDCVKN